MVTAYVDALSPGSFLALSHLTTDHAPDAAAAAQMQYAATSSPVWPRTEAWFTKQFIGLDLLAPGITTPAGPSLASAHPRRSRTSTAVPCGCWAKARHPGDPSQPSQLM